MDKSVETIIDITIKYFKFFDNFTNSNTNLVFSSLSLYILIKILQLAADSQTYNEIINFTKTSDNDNKIYKFINYDSDETLVTIQNKLFIKYDTNLLFNQNIQNLYNTNIEKVNFSNVLVTVKIIDDWIFNATNGIISDVMKNNNYIRSNTVLVLISTLYFKAKWKFPFQKFNTKNGKFYLNNEKIINTFYMKQIEFLKHLKDEKNNFEIVEIPYSNKRYSAIFLITDYMNLINLNINQVIIFNNILTLIDY